MKCCHCLTGTMCDKAEEAHTAMLLHLLEVDNVEGFLSYLEMYEWDDQILLPCLQLCLRERKWTWVEALIDSGATCDAKCIDLLSAYVTEGDEANVLDVLRKSANNGLKTDQCSSLMFCACMNGCSGIVRYLLDVGCDPNVQCADSSYLNRTYLIASTLTRHDDVSAMFLDHPDTDMTLCDKNGTTALHAAIQSCRHELLSRYIDRCPAMLEFRNASASTPLQTAIMQNCELCSRILIEHGSDLNAQTKLSECSVFGATPLMLSIARQTDAITELLIGDPRCDVNAVDLFTGMTALHRAADIGDLHVVKLLLENGACANPVDRDSATPLLLAINERHVGVAFELLPYVGWPDPTGKILSMAYDRGLFVLLEPLIYLGAKIVDLFYDKRTKQRLIDLFNWDALLTTPKSLKHQVMLLIRRTLRTVTEIKVNSLCLPNQLIELILVRKWLAKIPKR